jgi:nucleotide-binding universal stress UspA family protein
MTRIVAAINSSAISRTVLDRAVELAKMLGFDVDAVHVREDGSTTARSCAETIGVRLDERTGYPAEIILSIGDADDVAMVAFGARDHAAGPRPTGHLTRALLRVFTKPCLVVPPEASCDHPLRRVIVMLEADPTKARVLDELVDRTCAAGAEVTVLHVDDEGSLPKFSDQIQHETAAYEREFLRRYAPEGGKHVQLELRVGNPAQELLELVDKLDADLVVLSWRGILDPGRAPVVQELLTRIRIPLLLVPIPDLEPGRTR